MYWVFLTKGSFDKTGGFFPDIIISTSQSALAYLKQRNEILKQPFSDTP